MSNVYTAFETSQDLELNGILVDYGTFRWRIARAGGANRKFASMLDRKLRPHRRAINAGVFDEDSAARIMAECFAETVVKGWDSKLTDETGEERWEPVMIGKAGERLEFTRENVVKVLLDLPALFEDLRAQSQEISNFLAAEREEAGKA